MQVVGVLFCLDTGFWGFGWVILGWLGFGLLGLFAVVVGLNSAWGLVWGFVPLFFIGMHKPRDFASMKPHILIRVTKGKPWQIKNVVVSY